VSAAKSQGLSGSRRNWKSIELGEPGLQRERIWNSLRRNIEREHAMEQLSQYSEWWRNPLPQKREHTNDLAIVPVFFSHSTS